jgi:hypothetical protein
MHGSEERPEPAGEDINGDKELKHVRGNVKQIKEKRHGNDNLSEKTGQT